MCAGSQSNSLLGFCAPSSVVSVASGWWVAAVGFVVACCLAAILLMWLLEHTSGEDCNNGDGGVNTADGPSSEIPSGTFGPALNETGHQDENIGSAAHKGDEETSEDDWLEREESAED